MNQQSLWLVLIFAVGAMLAPVLSAQPAPSVEEGARSAVARFFAALDALDADAFVECFTADASIFYPQTSQPRRVQGRVEIRASIEREFDAAREGFQAAGKTAPPFLSIEPLDMKVQVLSPGIAVVTWHVDRKTHRGRRTAVVQRFGEAWSIVSLHSSNMAYP